MNIKKAKGADGKILYYAIYPLAKGRKYLKANGWAECCNPMYYTRTTQNSIEYIHYNKITKSWILEVSK